MNEIYFNGKDGNPIKKGDKCYWNRDKETIWIIVSNPRGMDLSDNYHPDSDYMMVWAKPESEISDEWNNKWVRRKTKGFTKI